MAHLTLAHASESPRLRRAVGFTGLLVFLVSATMVLAQEVRAARSWHDAPGLALGRPAADYWVKPQKFRPVAFDHPAMQAALLAAPMEFSPKAMPVEIELPMPDGSSQRFKVVESPVMVPELAARFPEIKTYVGQGVDDPAATVRLDFSPAGFHAQVLSPNGAVYIDPHLRDRSVYASYFKREYRQVDDEFRCLVPAEAGVAVAAVAPLDLARSGANLRTYRLAVAATGEYTQFHGGTVALGLAAVVTAVNRVTGVYETELAIRFVLVANNNLIIYTDSATDPYNNTNSSTLLTQNQASLDAVIGSANYDIGHVFSTAGGGLASLGVVCVSGWKARGETGKTSPIGDAFYIDYVAHEMGHQFGANHTFNSTLGFCSGNRNSSTAYEPGSGSTIMAYAGICSGDDLQAHSDPYFHAASFDEIVAYSTTGSGSSCPATTTTGNTAPTVNAGASYTIPIGTPFTLTASGSDANGDTLTYCWEERDLGSSVTNGAPDNGSSPLFRSYNASSSPSRTFPQLSNLLNNTMSVGETLPTTSRALKFRVTARDNRAGGGGVNTADTTVTSTTAAGPFAITSHNSGGTFSDTTTVTWNVASSASSPVNAADVKISLSMDGGLTFPTVLMASTPNDGSQTVTLPKVFTSTARIKVEAVGNIFFDINNTNFSILPSATPLMSISSAALAGEGCSPTNGAIDPGEAVTLKFALKNSGTGNTTNLVATLLSTNGVTSLSAAQIYGAILTNGASVTQAFSFAATGACGGPFSVSLKLQEGTNDLGIVTQQLTFGAPAYITRSFTNASTITINDKANASPFPSSITVAGLTGTVSKVTVTLRGITHTWPDDIDALLVSPSGSASAMVMSDAGSDDLSNGFPLSGVTLTFDDAASGLLPDSSQIVAGTYKPTDYNVVESFTAPAPAGPYGSALAAFNGLNPNGAWSLYVVDDALDDFGNIGNGWSLAITTVSISCTTCTPQPVFQQLTRTNNVATLRWSAVSNAVYRLQVNTNLSTTNWFDLPGDVTATNTTVSKTDTNSAGQRFYRVRVLP